MLHAALRPSPAVVSVHSLLGIGLLFIAPTSAAAEPITLNAAITRAVSAHPDVGIAEADVGASQGRSLAAKTRPYNPELGISAAPVRVAGSTFTDYEVTLGQTFELGGKRARRVGVASAELSSARARKDWTRREVELRARRAYYLAALDRALVATAKDAQVAADEAKEATEERLRQKAGTQLEVNVASADVGRARRALLDAERTYLVARAELGAAVGAKPGEDLEPAEDAPLPPEPPAAEDPIVSGALAARPDLRAVRFQRDAAAAGVALADAEATPDVGVSVGYSRERDPDQTFHRFSINLSIPLPIFDRKQGQRAVARAELNRAEIVDTAVRWQAERDIRTTFRAYQKAREAVLAFDLDVVGKLDENLKLARESFQTGKIGLLEFNVVRRNLVETRIAYLEARREAIEALIALELAAGNVEVFR